MEAPTVNSEPKKSKNVLRLVMQVGLLISAAGIGYGAHYMLSVDARKAQAEVIGLREEKSTLSKEGKTLEEKNKNLSSSIGVLQEQLPSSEVTSQVSGEIDGPAPVTMKMVISEVKNMPGATFATAGYTPPKGNFKVVYTTITNLTNAEQKYDVFQFSAVTKTGVIVQPSVFSLLETQGLWNNSALAPGGVQNIVLLFPQDLDIVVLRHTPSSVSVSVPASVN